MNNQKRYQLCKQDYVHIKTIKTIKTNALRMNSLIGSQLGGNINDKYIEMADELNKEGLSKTNILAKVLSQIMRDMEISNQEYMIIASYCLKEFREVTDLDVIILKDAYSKLKSHQIGEISIAKISGDERIVFKLSNIDENAEIEFFPKNEDDGFPTNKFSIKNLHETNSLQYDDYGNAYYNIEMCIEQYADVVKRDDKYFMGGIFEISSDRIRKNISHMEKIKDLTEHSTNNKIVKNLVETKIRYLKSLLL